MERSFRAGEGGAQQFFSQRQSAGPEQPPIWQMAAAIHLLMRLDGGGPQHWMAAEVRIAATPRARSSMRPRGQLVQQIVGKRRLRDMVGTRCAGQGERQSSQRPIPPGTAAQL